MQPEHRRQIPSWDACFTKGKLCAADGTFCSPNIAGKSQVGSPTMFNISSSSKECDEWVFFFSEACVIDKSEEIVGVFS